MINDANRPFLAGGKGELSDIAKGFEEGCRSFRDFQPGSHLYPGSVGEAMEISAAPTRTPFRMPARIFDE